LENLHRPVAIGPYTTRGNLFLAPVAGYSDAAYRSLCVDEGADLCCTEMVSAEALTRGHRKTRSLLARAENEAEYAIQLFGAKPEVLGRAAALLAEWKPSLVDLNCGCPVPKIVKAGAGSALMRDPPAMGRIVRAMRDAMDAAGMGGVPLTVKFRLGWDGASLNYLDFGRIAADAGAAALTLHARTRAQGYSGKADWRAIATLAAAMAPLPVFGSGDANTGPSARAMLEETGAAGVMVARGAMGNPFVFRAARAALEGRAVAAPDARERAEAARRHLRLSVRFLGERTACAEFRKHFCAYTKGSPSGASLRADAVRATTPAEFDALCGRWIAAAEAAGEVSGS
jgi:nifR3 family TIM-barrel protein